MSKTYEINDLFRDFPATCSMTLAESMGQIRQKGKVKEMYMWLHTSQDYLAELKKYEPLIKEGFSPDQIEALVLITHSFGGYRLRSFLNHCFSSGENLNDMRVLILCIYGGLMRLQTVPQTTPMYYMLQNRSGNAKFESIGKTLKFTKFMSVSSNSVSTVDSYMLKLNGATIYDLSRFGGNEKYIVGPEIRVVPSKVDNYGIYSVIECRAFEKIEELKKAVNIYNANIARRSQATPGPQLVPQQYKQQQQQQQQQYQQYQQQQGNRAQISSQYQQQQPRQAIGQSFMTSTQQFQHTNVPSFTTQSQQMQQQQQQYDVRGKIAVQAQQSTNVYKNDMPSQGSTNSAAPIEDLFSRWKPEYVSLYDSLVAMDFGNGNDEKSKSVAKDLMDRCKETIKYLNDQGVLKRYGLTEDEARAITIFTFDYGAENMDRNPQRIVNKALGTRDTHSGFCMKGYLIHLLSALRKLPQYKESEVLYRGINGENISSNYVIGGTKTWPAFTSTYPDEDSALDFLSGDSQILFEIHGDFCGYNIQDFSIFHEEGKKKRRRRRRIRVCYDFYFSILIWIMLNLFLYRDYFGAKHRVCHKGYQG